jgi:hypothetical protein
MLMNKIKSLLRLQKTEKRKRKKEKKKEKGKDRTREQPKKEVLDTKRLPNLDRFRSKTPQGSDVM